MATELAVGYVSLVPSAKGITSGIQKELTATGAAASKAGASAGKSFGSKFASGIKSVAKVGALGLLGIAAVATKIGIDSVKEAEHSQKIARQTGAVIKSTGAAAGVSAKQVGQLASQLSFKAGIDDEVIQSGENVLLTFTKVRNEVGKGNDIFTQATGAALDMSVALGQDMQSSVIQLGKALNDPIKGITALRRVGVSFTSDQIKQIKTLVSHGKTLEAQKVILRELKTEFGGSAAAQATATDRLKVAFHNVSEEIGKVLLPYVDKLSTWIQTKGLPLIQAKLVPAIARFALWIQTKAVPALRDKWLPTLTKIGNFISRNVVPIIEKLGNVFRGLSVPTQSTIVLLGVLLLKFPKLASVAGKAVGGLATTLARVGKGFVKGLAGVSKSAEGASTSIAESFGSMAAAAAKSAVSFAITVAKTVAGWILMGVQALINAAKIAIAWVISLGPIALVIAAVIAAAIIIVKNWDTIKRFVIGAAKAVVGFLQRNWPLILAIITGPLGLAVLAVVRNWDKIAGAFSAIWSFIRSIWSTTWTWVKNFVGSILSAIVRGFVAYETAVIKIFAGAATWLLQAGKNLILGLWSGIQQIWRLLWGSLTSAKNGIKANLVAIFNKATDWLTQGGKNIVNGLWSGIKEAWKDVVKWLKGLPGHILDALGIHSPPKWAIEAGRWVMKGVTKGLGLGVGSVLSFMGKLAGKFGGPLKAAWDVFSGGGGGDIRHLGSFQQLGKNIAEAAGFVGTQWNALRELWQNESGWNPSARNKSSGAFGIPQALPASKMGAAAQASNRNLVTRAAAQIRWGLAYIRQTYGSPAAALAKWKSRTPHWYARGAWETGDELARLHRGEMVLPARIAESVRSALVRSGAPAGPAAGPVAQFGDVYLNDGVDVDLLSRRLEFTIAGGRL
jgi:hypothetical protein